MSDLLAKALLEDDYVDILIHWLLKNDITVPQNGINQTNFAEYLHEFLRRHTRSLLPTQDQTPNHSALLLSPTSTTISEGSVTPFQSSTPIRNRNHSRSTTPFNSSGNTPPSRSNQFPKCSPNSMSQLEKRLTHKEPKSFQLSDFVVTKEKQSKQKKKKRVSLISCVDQDVKPTEQSVTIPETIVRSAEDDEKTATASVSCDIKPRHRKLLRKLGLLYSASITANLIRDLLKELNYLISLLASDTGTNHSYACTCENDDSLREMLQPGSKQMCLFRTQTEGTYFAAIVLENQWQLLRYLNKSTLGILCENGSLNAHVPQFVGKIRNFLDAVDSKNKNVNLINREILSDTVKFQMDTDCRPNYDDNESFYAFKKQRDEFYALLLEWKDVSQRRSSTEFFKSRLKRLRQVVTMCSHITNMFRLADLFVSQILASVFNENVENGSGVAVTKLDLLNRRFVTPCSIVIGNEKRFPGVQEFFKDFLRSSSENSFFLSHVRDVLVQRIIALNNFKYSCDVVVSLERQELFLVSINKLCLLAKFLSLITFLPYHDKHDLPPHLRIPLAEARKNVLPPLDLLYYLTNSIKSGRMVITIPWIVEFLNGIDNTSILLPVYKMLLAKLQYLLYKLKLPSAVGDAAVVDDTICVRLAYADDACKLWENCERGGAPRTVSVRELREAAARRDDEFAQRFVDDRVQTIDYSRILIALYVNSLFNNVPASTVIKIEDISTLKDGPIVFSDEFYMDETTLYQCCPHLYEIRALLEGGKKLSFKSITPKTEKTYCDRRVEKAAVDVLLETHFFSNLPKTVKKCVDFVAEVISSHCVKSIQQKLMPKLKQTIEGSLRARCGANCNVDETKDFVLASFYETLRNGVKEHLNRFRADIEHCLRGLIEVEVADETVTNICVGITCRMCTEIVYNWVFNYINVNDMLKKVQENVNDERERQLSSAGRLIDERKTKKKKSDLKKIVFEEWVSTKREIDGDCSPVHVLHGLRHVIRRATGLMEYNGECKPSGAEVAKIVEEAAQCVQNRCDLQFIAFRRIMMLSVDVATTLVFYSPEIVDDTLLRKFKTLWTHRKVCGLHLNFETVLSARNVELYRESLATENGEGERVRKALTNFLVFAINEELLRTSRLYSQVLRLLRASWPEELLKSISECLDDVLSRAHFGREKIKFVIGWIADFIRDDVHSFDSE